MAVWGTSRWWGSELRGLNVSSFYMSFFLSSFITRTVKMWAVNTHCNLVLSNLHYVQNNEGNKCNSIWDSIILTRSPYSYSNSWNNVITKRISTEWKANAMRKEMFLLHIFLSLDDRLFLKLMFSFCSCEMMMIDKKWNRGDGGVSPACLVYILGDNYCMQTLSEDDSV